MTPPAGRPATAGPSWGIVVTTLGRPEPLARLLDSLAAQTYRRFVVAVCAQGRAEEVRELVESAARRHGLDVRFVAGDRTGAAAGRNLAAGLLPDSVDHLLFPNDTSTYEPDLLARLAERFPGSVAGALTVVDDFGPKLAIAGPGTRLTRRNAWAVILMGLVIRRDAFRELGGFDETLGTGAATAWQSGEETDLLLRLLAARGADLPFVWAPDLVVQGVPDTWRLRPADRRRKLRAYGRGYGRVVRVHSLGWAWAARALVAGVTFGLRHPRQYAISDGLPVALGRLEGLLGRPLGGPVLNAVRQ